MCMLIIWLEYLQKEPQESGNYGLPWCWGASCLITYSAFGHACKCSDKALVHETCWTWAGLQSAVSETLSARSLNSKVASRNHCRLCFKNSSTFIRERVETPLDTNCAASPFPFRCINYFKRWLFCQELSDCKIVRRLLEFVVASRSILGNGVVQEEDPQVTCCRTVTSLPQDSTDWQISSQSRHSKVTWHRMRGSDKQGCGEIKPKEYLAQLDLFTF